MWRADSLEKTLMLWKIEGKRRRGWQRMKRRIAYWHNGHEFELTLGDSGEQRSLVGYSPWGHTKWGSPAGSDSKESACNAGDLTSIPGSRRSPGEGNGDSLQYSCLENYMDRGAWWATVHGVAKSGTWLKD